MSINSFVNKMKTIHTIISHTLMRCIQIDSLVHEPIESNIHIWEAGSGEGLAFLLDNNQNSRQFIF